VLSSKKMEELIGLILTMGTLVSALLVIIGGTWYLIQEGSQNWHTELMAVAVTEFNLSFSATAIIEVGLLSLVATQLLRVALLVWYYAVQRDYRFTFISFFVLLVLIYSVHSAI
jgi:uncharacterized membrane protein